MKIKGIGLVKTVNTTDNEEEVLLKINNDF